MKIVLANFIVLTCRSWAKSRMTKRTYIDFLTVRKKNARDPKARNSMENGLEDAGAYDEAHLLKKEAGFSLEEGFNHTLYHVKRKDAATKELVMSMVEGIRQATGSSIEEKIRSFLTSMKSSDYEYFFQRFPLLYYANLSDNESEYLENSIL